MSLPRRSYECVKKRILIPNEQINIQINSNSIIDKWLSITSPNRS